MSDFKLVVLLSGNGSNLQAIIDAIEKGWVAARISAVISDKADAFGLKRAQEANIPTEVVTKLPGEERAAYDIRLKRMIDPYQPQLIVLAGFMRILSAPFVNQYLGKIINIHPSLLPKYPGLNTHSKALAAGDTTHGITIHYVIPALDAGPIIGQANLAIASIDTVDSLQQRVHQLEHIYYPQVIHQIATQKVRLEGDTVYRDNCAVTEQNCAFST